MEKQAALQFVLRESNGVQFRYDPITGQETRINPARAKVRLLRFLLFANPFVVLLVVTSRYVQLTSVFGSPLAACETRRDSQRQESQ